jgi:hypothetical protein
MMKLNKISESYDYGSKFMRKRTEVEKIAVRIQELEIELREALQAADIRDFGSDKDYFGGAKYIRQALAKLKAKLATKKLELAAIKADWEATGPLLGES